MRQAITVLAYAVGLAFLICLVWFFGMVFEFEYPYAFTLASVRNARSVYGVPVSGIIQSDGAKWPGRLQWHTCSYCADSCGDVKYLTCVTLEAPDRSTIYHFAYCREMHTLVPMTYGTAAHYPVMMPSNDPVRSVKWLSGGKGPIGNGYGDFQLPEKWFRKVTHTEPDGSADRSQPVRPYTNSPPAVAGSRR